MTDLIRQHLLERGAFPVVDSERENTTVITDFGVVAAEHGPTDETHALPVRFALGRGVDFEVHVGPYVFSDSQIDVLRRAVNAHLRTTQGPVNGNGEPA